MKAKTVYYDNQDKESKAERLISKNYLLKELKEIRQFGKQFIPMLGKNRTDEAKEHYVNLDVQEDAKNNLRVKARELTNLKEMRVETWRKLSKRR